MGSWGALIMGFFGAVFAALTMYWQWHFNGIVLLAPFLLSAMIDVAALYVIRLPGDGIKPSAAAERVITWSSIGEGIGLFLAANIVNNLHHPELLLPSMALVVGIHFIPIAAADSFRPFYILGTALIVVALAGFFIQAPTGGEVAGVGGACALWLAAIMAVRRDWRAKQTGPAAKAA